MPVAISREAVMANLASRFGLAADQALECRKILSGMWRRASSKVLSLWLMLVVWQSVQYVSDLCPLPDLS